MESFAKLLGDTHEKYKKINSFRHNEWYNDFDDFYSIEDDGIIMIKNHKVILLTKNDIFNKFIELLESMKDKDQKLTYQEARIEALEREVEKLNIEKLNLEYQLKQAQDAINK